MAPNNALRQRPGSTSSSDKDAANKEPNKTKTGTTTILPAGTVESRGIGVSSVSTCKDDATNETSNDNDTDDDTVITRSRVQRDIDTFLQGQQSHFFSYAWMKSELRCFFTVWTFITRFPGPTWVDHHPGYLMRGMVYFPIGGAIIGMWMAAWFNVCYTTLQLPASISACITIAANVYMTGCFHEDGLGDASDGFGGGWSRRQILTIMTDTRLGTFGCVALILYLQAKCALIAALTTIPTATTLDSDSSATTNTTPTVAVTLAALVLSQALARSGPTYMIHTFAYVDEGGPKNQYYSFMIQARQLVSTGRVVVAVCYCIVLATLLLTWCILSSTQAIDVFNVSTSQQQQEQHQFQHQFQHQPGILFLISTMMMAACFIMAIVLIIAHCAGAYATYMIGGVMGDFLGAIICGTEIVVLILIYMVAHHYNRIVNAVIAVTILTSNSHVQTWWQEATMLMARVLGISRNPRLVLLPSLSWQHWLLDPDSGWGALVRFVAVLLFTVVWCRNVGHPNVFVRETVVAAMEAKEENDDDNGNGVPIGLPKLPVKGKSDASNSPTSSTTTSASSCPLRAAAEAICQSATSSFTDRYHAAYTYLDALAKPMGSLGTLEEWAARLAALQRTTRIQVTSLQTACLVFAADHGVAAHADTSGGESASAYPQSVTRSILHGLQRDIGGASVLAQCCRGNVSVLRVVDVGVAGDDMFQTDNENDNGNATNTANTAFTVVVSSERKLVGGTRNFCRTSAMTLVEMERCVQIGRDEVAHMMMRDTSTANVRVLVLGEVGIGNTTSSSALIAYLAKAPVDAVCGGGATTTRTVTQEAIDKKRSIVQKALALHQDSIASPMDALARLGGAEIAALVGAILEASERDVAVLVDGFVLTAAALVAANIAPISCRVFIFATQSAEPGQGVAIKAIQAIAAANNMVPPARPALDMGLRMGEGTGALLALPLLHSAACVMNEMGTIAAIMS